MQTQTFGERFGPPHVRTAIGSANYAERTVLIALKNLREAAQFADMYRRMGWRVLVAERPSRFIAMVREESVDLVVTDKVPYIATVRLLRRDGRVPATHIVAPDPSSARTALAAGADAVMVRSIRHDDFFSYDVVTRPDWQE
jgi:hypothetical protein